MSEFTWNGKSVLVTGADRRAFLNNLLTADLRELPPGAVRPAGPCPDPTAAPGCHLFPGGPGLATILSASERRA